MSANRALTESIECDDPLERLSLTGSPPASLSGLPRASFPIVSSFTGAPSEAISELRARLSRHGDRLALRLLALAICTVIGVARAQQVLPGGQALGWTFVTGVLLLLLAEKRRAPRPEAIRVRSRAPHPTRR